jgi:hypothetical protein
MPHAAAHRLAAVSILALLSAGAAQAQNRGETYTLYGVPGLIEMPSAISAPDGEISGTVGYFSNEIRNSFTFQITERMSGTFRYAGIEDYAPPTYDVFYDRSFDLSYRFTDEGDLMPMIAVGMRDVLGTGLYASEYVVATKTISDSIRVTGGLGWGRLGTYNGFGNPLGFLGEDWRERPPGYELGTEGGTPSLGTRFRGDAALFGGLEWAYAENLIFKAEYSSDDGYRDINGAPLIDRNTPLNFGVTYIPFPGYQFALSYLYGSELAFTGTIAVNPNNRVFPGGLDAPPHPVVPRGDARAAASWDLAGPPPADVTESLRQDLRSEGIVLAGIEVTGTTARVRYTNTRYRSEAQGMGRVARVLTAHMPPEIDTFILEPMQEGMPLSGQTLRRSDLEQFENTVGGTDEMLARTQFGPAGPDEGLIAVPSGNDPFTWGLAPYFSLSLFNGANPYQLSFGAELSATYRFSPGTFMEGSIRQRLVSNSGDAELVTDENWPVVRRNKDLYTEEGNPGIAYLTFAHYGRLADTVFGRVTIGYLEEMYGGISTEVLWKPVQSRWALGAEVNYVLQRDFDKRLGFQDFETATGHVSAYYALPNGFHGQIDFGRYLAGDWGGTFGLDREFENGWRVGAYFTLTNMPFDEFGEGSFDKGIRLTIPTDFILGNPNRSNVSTELQSLNRDGGARLSVNGRLYEVVRDGHYGDMSASWGRFWR